MHYDTDTSLVDKASPLGGGGLDSSQQSRQQMLDRQRMLMEQRNKKKRMTAGMVIANQSVSRPVSSRSSRASSRQSNIEQLPPPTPKEPEPVCSTAKSSSESSLEEVFLDSPGTSRSEVKTRLQSTVIGVSGPSPLSPSSSSSSESYATRLLKHGSEEELISGSTSKSVQQRLGSLGMTSLDEHSSDEEGERGMSVAPVIGWKEEERPNIKERDTAKERDIAKERPIIKERDTSEETDSTQDIQHNTGVPVPIGNYKEETWQDQQAVIEEQHKTLQLDTDDPHLLDVPISIGNLLDFVMRPAPEGVTVKCRITRQKGLYPVYYLHLDDSTASGPKRFLLAGRKRKKSKTSNYILSIDPTDLSRGGENCIGKLKSNFVGTSFTLYDSGVNPGKSVAMPDGSNVRRELAAVLYETNVLGFKGPRKMTVVVPPLSPSLEVMATKPRTESESLLETWRSGTDDNLIMLNNKQPQWSSDSQAYVLNFHGRVTQASVKNFQLVHHSNNDHVVLQFGRITSEVFTMDYSLPLSALQAFAIALSSFDSKLACE